MDYQEAEKIRKKSFGSLLGEQEGGLGSSLKSAISQKTKAKITGIKETFDPMNMARAVGGKTGAAIYGKVFGRDQKSMERFAGAKKKKGDVASVGDSVGTEMSSPADVLGLIYRLMIRADADKKLQEELHKNKLEEENKEEDDRNEQLIRALTGRKKPSRKEKKAEKRAEKKAEKSVEKKTEGKKPTEEKKPVTKEGKKPSAEKTTPKEAPQKPKEVPSKESPKPTESAKPSPKETTKPSVEKIKPPTITGGDKGVMDMVKLHEGVRTKPYKDSLGLWTIGVGHLIGDGKSLPPEWNRELTMKEVDELFVKDFEHHKSMAMKTPGWDKANETGQAAMIDLAFNMGGSWYKKWPATAKALAAGDFEAAAEGLKNSKWYEQVKSRAVKIVSMIRQAGKTTQKSESTDIPTTTGQTLSVASSENKELKRTASNDTPVPTVNSTTTNVQQTSSASPKPQSGDDRNAWQKKAQG